MAASWFVRGGGKVYGPLDSAKLKQLVAEGKINETTEVAQNQAGPWYPAGKVRGLFETAPVTPASAPAPQTYAAPQPYIPPPAPIAESPAEDLPAAPIVNIARRTLSTYYPRSNNGTMVLVAGLCSVASLGLGYFAGREHLRYQIRSSFEDAGKSDSLWPSGVVRCATDVMKVVDSVLQYADCAASNVYWWMLRLWHAQLSLRLSFVAKQI